MKNIDAFYYFQMFIQNYYYYLVRKKTLSIQPVKPPTTPFKITVNPNVKYGRDTVIFDFDKKDKPDFIDLKVMEFLKTVNHLRVEHIQAIYHTDKNIFHEETNTLNKTDRCSIAVNHSQLDASNKYISKYHNHPSGWLSDFSEKGHGGTCFSPPDWENFVNGNYFKRMYVSNPIFLYRVIKPLKPIEQQKALSIVRKTFWSTKGNGEIYLELHFVEIAKACKYKYKRFLINKNAPCINLFASKLKLTKA